MYVYQHQVALIGLKHLFSLGGAVREGPVCESKNRT